MPWCYIFQSSVSERNRLRRATSSCHKLLQILRIEKRLSRNHALPREKKLPRRIRIISERSTQLIDFRGRRQETREMKVLLIVRPRRLIALPLVVLQRVSQPATAGETIVQRIDKPLNVAKRITHAERKNRIFVTPGVTNQRPPRAVRLSKEIWNIGRPTERFLTSPGSNPRR